MSLDTLITMVCSISMSLLGLIIFLRNPRARTNRFFGFLALSIAFWTVFNLISGGTSTNPLLLIMVYLGGIASAYSLLLFMSNFPNENIVSSKVLKIFTIATLLVAASTFHPEFITEVTKDEFSTGYLYPVFIVYIIGGLVLLLVAIAKQIRASKSASKRQQIVLLSWGVLLYAVFTLLSNVAIPFIVNDWSSSRVGPIFSLILVAVVAYSIVKHRLFDIRLVIARLVAYSLLLSTMIGGYALIVFELTENINYPADLEFIRSAVPFIAAIVVAITFNPLKKFFDKLTNRFFYQDAYEPQALLNDLNNMLVTTIDISTILKNTSLLIEHYLRSQEVVFFIYEVKGVPQKFFSTGEKSTESIKKLATIVKKFPEKVTVVDIAQGLDSTLRSEAVNNDVSMVIHLDSPNEDKAIGSLVLAPKKSGSIYGKQDHRVMAIIADELAIAIQNALRFEEIQAFNITLQEKVEDATRKLRRANEKLIALDQTKDDFISMASHQLRTPLTSVKGYISMVIEGDVGKISSQQKKLLDQAYVSSQRMVYLIADLLNVSRLKTGKFVIEPKPTNLAEVVEGEIQQLTETAASRELTLTYEKPKEFPVLNLDETKIRQVIMNFVDNAIYYTPAKGNIKVSVAEHDDTIEFTVTDDGIGVPKSEQHNLFNKFYRAGNAKKARPDGTGLGLFMAKKVVIAQGGNIIFKSQEGKGSTFGFSFSKKHLASVKPIEAAKSEASPKSTKSKKTKK